MQQRLMIGALPNLPDLALYELMYLFGPNRITAQS